MSLRHTTNAKLILTMFRSKSAKKKNNPKKLEKSAQITNVRCRGRRDQSCYSCFLIFLSFKILKTVFLFIFFNNFYTQHRAGAPDPEIKSCTLCD